MELRGGSKACLTEEMFNVIIHVTNKKIAKCGGFLFKGSRDWDQSCEFPSSFDHQSVACPLSNTVFQLVKLSVFSPFKNCFEISIKE